MWYLGNGRYRGAKIELSSIDNIVGGDQIESSFNVYAYASGEAGQASLPNGTVVFPTNAYSFPLDQKLATQHTISDFDAWDPTELGLSVGDLTICRCAGDTPGSPSGSASASVTVRRIATNTRTIEVSWAGNLWARTHVATSETPWGNWDIILGRINITDFDSFDPTKYIYTNGVSCDVFAGSDAVNKPEIESTTYVCGTLRRISISIYTLEVERAGATSHRKYSRVYADSVWGNWEVIY